MSSERSRAARPRERRSLRAAVAALVAASLACALQAASGGASTALADTATGGTSASSRSSVVLRLGSRGPTVARVQRRLGLPADGVYGRRTRAAVIRFQRRRRLTADGIAGPATLRALGVRPVQRRRPARRSGGSISAILERIAECESGGNPRAISPDGRYRGKYQFTRATWRSVGGSGDPARASEAEQDRRARILYRRAGADPWGVCGERAVRAARRR